MLYTQDDIDYMVNYYRTSPFKHIRANRSNYRMSVLATERERDRFLNRLPRRLDEMEFRAFTQVIYLEQVDTYDDWRHTPYMYFKLRDSENWILVQRIGKYTFRDITKSEKRGIISVELGDHPVERLRAIPYLRDIDISDIQLDTSGLPEGFKWSAVKTKKINYVADYLKRNVLARYAMFQRPKNGLSNVITDSFVPKLMYQFNFDLNQIQKDSNLPATSLMISPWFANIFGTKQMEVEQMARILGYTKRDIKRLLVEVRKKKHNVVFVGFGGTGVNTVHWLTELCSMTHVQNLFDKLTIFEPDNLEISNLFRFPKNPETIISQSRYNRTNYSKLCLLTDYEKKTLSRRDCELYPKRLEYYDLYGDIKDSIFYGAPTISTRQMLSGIDGMKFISATHTGNSCYIHLNPIQDDDIQLETYGLIQLSIFFMNQLKMAISFLEVLANDEIDLTEKDVEVMNYTFTQDDSLTTDRKYHFQLDHDGHMVTEEEANAVV